MTAAQAAAALRRLAEQIDDVKAKGQSLRTLADVQAQLGQLAIIVETL